MATQTTVANIPSKSAYASTDYLIVDDLSTTNKMQLSVIESAINEKALEYVEAHYSSEITENTVFNVNGTVFNLSVTEV